MHHITLWAKKLNNNIWLIQLPNCEPIMAIHSKLQLPNCEPTIVTVYTLTSVIPSMVTSVIPSMVTV